MIATINNNGCLFGSQILTLVFSITLIFSSSLTRDILNVKENLIVYGSKLWKASSLIPTITLPFTSATDGNAYNELMKSLIGDFDISVKILSIIDN
jgi:hypothetical protein